MFALARRSWTWTSALATGWRYRWLAERSRRAGRIAGAIRVALDGEHWRFEEAAELQITDCKCVRASATPAMASLVQTERCKVAPRWAGLRQWRRRAPTGVRGDAASCRAAWRVLDAERRDEQPDWRSGIAVNAIRRAPLRQGAGVSLAVLLAQIEVEARQQIVGSRGLIDIPILSKTARFPRGAPRVRRDP